MRFPFVGGHLDGQRRFVPTILTPGGVIPIPIWQTFIPAALPELASYGSYSQGPIDAPPIQNYRFVPTESRSIGYYEAVPPVV